MDVGQLTQLIREAAARVTNAPNAQEYTESYQEWADLCGKREKLLAAASEDY